MPVKFGDKVFKDAQIEKLVDTMTSLDARTREEVLRGIGTRLTQAGKADIIKTVTQLIQSTDPAVKEWLAKAIPQAYVDGLNHADKVSGLGKGTITVEQLKTISELSIHIDAVNALLSNAYLDFAGGMNGLVKGVERQLNEAVRRQIRAKIASNVLSGSNIQTVKREIKNELGSRGFSVLVDRGGNNWSLPRYSEMLARTHVMKSSNDALINRAGQFGVDIVQMSTHSGACPICTPLEGKIYSLSGNSASYPRVEIYPPIHPNCRHVLLMRPDLQAAEDEKPPKE